MNSENENTVQDWDSLLTKYAQVACLHWKNQHAYIAEKYPELFTEWFKQILKEITDKIIKAHPKNKQILYNYFLRETEGHIPVVREAATITEIGPRRASYREKHGLPPLQEGYLERAAEAAALDRISLALGDIETGRNSDLYADLPRHARATRLLMDKESTAISEALLNNSETELRQQIKPFVLETLHHCFDKQEQSAERG